MVPSPWHWVGGATSPVATQGPRPHGNLPRALLREWHQRDRGSGRMAPAVEIHVCEREGGGREGGRREDR